MTVRRHLDTVTWAVTSVEWWKLFLGHCFLLMNFKGLCVCVFCSHTIFFLVKYLWPFKKTEYTEEKKIRGPNWCHFKDHSNFVSCFFFVLHKMSWKLAIYFKTKFSYIYLVDDDVIWQFFQRASSRKWRLYLNIIKVKFSVKSEDGSKVKTNSYMAHDFALLILFGHISKFKQKTVDILCTYTYI